MVVYFKQMYHFLPQRKINLRTLTFRQHIAQVFQGQKTKIKKKFFEKLRKHASRGVHPTV
jgi:hypothetical protein